MEIAHGSSGIQCGGEPAALRWNRSGSGWIFCRLLSIFGQKDAWFYILRNLSVILYWPGLSFIRREELWWFSAAYLHFLCSRHVINNFRRTFCCFGFLWYFLNSQWRFFREALLFPARSKLWKIIQLSHSPPDMAQQCNCAPCQHFWRTHQVLARFRIAFFTSFCFQLNMPALLNSSHMHPCTKYAYYHLLKREKLFFGNFVRHLFVLNTLLCIEESVQFKRKFPTPAFSAGSPYSAEKTNVFHLLLDLS